MARVLIADDEVKLGRLLAEVLEGDGHEVKQVSSGRAALIELQTQTFEVVVTDLRMPEVDGLEVLRAAMSLPGPPDVLLMTAYGTAESAVAAMKAGAADYLIKPFSIEELRLRVRRMAERRGAEATRARLVERLTPGLVAESPKMKEVLAAATRVAPTEATVLLLGESGTGKTQLARFIHFHSKRAAGPLAELHCAALPEPLLESELFGHVRGAFTGADRPKEGHLAASNSGTLFLDEIGEVTQATQVKLLRFLQERVFCPVGATISRTVDARVIAATNRELAVAVKEGSFREDFFYRLNVFSLTVPPLRERREDIPALVERFLASRGLPANKLSSAARERLVAHPWPGNVRELENALERALILSGEDQVAPSHLELGERGRARIGLGEVLGEGFNLDDFEKRLIYSAIERAGGNKTAAAKLLGITRRRLYSRLKSMGEEDSAA